VHRISYLRWGVPSVPPHERSLYLYFLDRELGDAVGYQLSPLNARQAAKILVIATNARLMCGLSLLYENNNLDRSTVRFFGDLLSVGVLDVISHYYSFPEFIASRQAMYRHDAGRYPAYFNDVSLPVLNPTVTKTGGTTARIVAGMSQWAIQIPDIDSRYPVVSSQLRAPVMAALQERDDRAVTFSLFRDHMGGLADSVAAQSQIRRTISRFFATDYRDFGDNDIPTGIRGLTYFEQDLAVDFPFYDVQILSHLLRMSGLSDALAIDRINPAWESALFARGSDGHTFLASAIRWIVSAFVEVLSRESSEIRQDEMRFRIITMLRRLATTQPSPQGSISGDDLYEVAASNASVLARQLSEDRRLAEALERSKAEHFPPIRADVLLVVATEIESEAIIEVFSENGHLLAGPMFSSTNAYQLFAPIAGARVALVRCSMGPGGPGGPELTVAEAISALKPTSVVMPGIAFGVNSENQKIGQVLLSTHVFDYGLERVGTDKFGRPYSMSRGARPDASPRLIGRFQAARLHTHGLIVQEGVFLSGNKLVDNVDYRESLRLLCPEAIGGEMEGFGVYAAAARAHVDWVIVKAICDWADGRKRTRKRQRQNIAARNAAVAVVRTLEHGGFDARN
jgi:nucleoside phosphorylase